MNIIAGGTGKTPVPINFAILDADGTILWTNKAWHEFGEENNIQVRPDTVGLNYLDVTKNAETPAARTVASGLEDLLMGEQDLVEVEYPCHSPSENRWFLMRAAPFSIDETRYVAVAHLDITERVEAERDVERFQRAIETAGHAIFLTDATGEITYVNPAFEEITGYGREEAVGETPQLLKSNEMDKEFYSDLWATVTSGDTWEGTLINRRKSGALYYAHQTITPITDENGTISEFVAIQTDITELREVQKQTEKLNNVLRHDLRNQLNTIQGYADLIGGGEGDAKTHTATISETVTKLLSTAEKGRKISMFLSTTRVPEPENIAEKARAAVATVKAEYPTVPVSIDAPEEAVGLSAGQVQTAIRELIENGIVHNNSDTPRVEITVDVVPEWIEVQVADNGGGVPDIESAPLESDKVSQLYHDSGFGLNLVYWIVRRSGGQLSFSTDETEESVVTIRLPRPAL